MADPEVFRVRVFFEKKGRLAYLSHLEVARSLERAIRRAQLPCAISQGFSPHMKISFGSALPVGVGGLKECFDLQLTQYVSPERVCEALQSASVSDLMVTACTHINKKEPAASLAYPIGTYEIVLSGPLDVVAIPESITVIRKKKEKILTVADYLHEPITHENNKMNIVLVSKQSGSLRIDILIKHLLQGTDVRSLSITRTNQRTF